MLFITVIELVDRYYSDSLTLQLWISLHLWTVEFIIFFNSVEFVHFYYSRFSGNYSSEVSLFDWVNYTFHIYYFIKNLISSIVVSIHFSGHSSELYFQIEFISSFTNFSLIVSNIVYHFWLHIYYLKSNVFSLWHLRAASDLLYNCYTQLLYTFSGAEKSVT